MHLKDNPRTLRPETGAKCVERVSHVEIAGRFGNSANSWAEWKLNIACTLNTVHECRWIAALMSSKLWNPSAQHSTGNPISPQIHTCITAQEWIYSHLPARFHWQIFWSIFPSNFGWSASACLLFVPKKLSQKYSSSFINFFYLPQ